MKKQNLQSEIKKVFLYFSFFSYAPTEEEIYMFLEKRVSNKIFLQVIQKMVKEEVLIKKTIQKQTKYTLGEYTTGFWESQKFKVQRSKFKVKKIQRYVKILSQFPQIKLIGLSGSVGMMNADEGDDIDLFIITSKNRLWTGRIIAVVVAELMGIRRKRTMLHRRSGTKDKICLNLFFDEKELKIPKKKQTKYVAHEVLQMKPLWMRSNVYNHFLEANSWVFKLFPNASRSMSNFLAPLGPVSTMVSLPQSRKNSTSSFGDVLERLLKHMQLKLINKHRTSEIITDTQLWFFPDDFEKKLNKE